MLIFSRASACLPSLHLDWAAMLIRRAWPLKVTADTEWRQLHGLREERGQHLIEQPLLATMPDRCAPKTALPEHQAYWADALKPVTFRRFMLGFRAGRCFSCTHWSSRRRNLGSPGIRTLNAEIRHGQTHRSATVGVCILYVQSRAAFAIIFSHPSVRTGSPLLSAPRSVTSCSQTSAHHEERRILQKSKLVGFQTPHHTT